MKTLKLMLSVAGGVLLAYFVLTGISYLLARERPRILGSSSSSGHQVADADTAAFWARVRAAKRAAQAADSVQPSDSTRINL